MKTQKKIGQVLLLLVVFMFQVFNTAMVKADTQNAFDGDNEIIDKTLNLGFYKNKTLKHATYFNPYGPNGSSSSNFMDIWAYNGENGAGGPIEFSIGMEVLDSNPELDGKIKTILNWILPTQGNYFYSILDDARIYPSNIEAIGKDQWTKEQINLIKSYGFAIIDGENGDRISLVMTLDGRRIQVEFSKYVPLFVMFGPVEKDNVKIGWKYINNNYYYFDTNGVMKKWW